MDGIVISELQADEIRTIIHDKEQPSWIFAAIEVWSRLWLSTVVGGRYAMHDGRNVLKIILSCFAATTISSDRIEH
jgi:hypothetical protein